MLSSLVPDHWKEVLQDYNSQIDELGLKLQKRADQGERILPDKKHLFRALEIKPEQVKVIIVGQDPYPNISDAIGLSFAVPPRKTGLPGSLLNIQKEIMTDIGSTTTADGGCDCRIGQPRRHHEAQVSESDRGSQHRRCHQDRA